MLRKILITGMLAMLVTVTVRAEDAAKKSETGNATFEKLKKMAGTWMEADKDGKPTEKVFSVVRVTASGSTVIETLYPGDAMEMVSVYHMDHGDVVMTHYCMLGNQPRMKADPSSTANQIRWQFQGGTNLDPAKDAHMHSAVVTFVDDDHIEIEGEAWEGGKPSLDHCGKAKIVRKK